MERFEHVPMQLALVNDEKVEAFSGGRGSCPICGADTIGTSDQPQNIPLQSSKFRNSEINGQISRFF